MRNLFRGITILRNLFTVILILRNPFAEQETHDYIQWHRRGKENITRIIIRPLNTLEYYTYVDRIAQVMQSEGFKLDNALLKHPEG